MFSAAPRARRARGPPAGGVVRDGPGRAGTGRDGDKGAVPSKAEPPAPVPCSEEERTVPLKAALGQGEAPAAEAEGTGVNGVQVRTIGCIEEDGMGAGG